MALKGAMPCDRCEGVMVRSRDSNRWADAPARLRAMRRARRAKFLRYASSPITLFRGCHIVAGQRQRVTAASELNLVIPHSAAFKRRGRPREIEGPHAKKAVAH